MASRQENIYRLGRIWRSTARMGRYGHSPARDQKRWVTSQQSREEDELLQVSELCLQFAKARQMHKTRRRFARAPSALRLLFAGDYHRYARGVKSFVQDLVIP